MAQPSNKKKDIINSSIYLRDAKDTNTISLILFVDGANFLNTSKGSYWVMFSMIAELPPIVRNSCKNILHHFMIASSTPCFETLLPKYMNQLDKLLKNGITIGLIGKVKVEIIAIIADGPGLAKICNVMQFNGSYGCFKCLHPGYSLGSGKLVYPNLTMIKRTNEIYQQQLKICEYENKTFQGVKGKTWLSNHIILPDMAINDFMHMVLEGTLRQLVVFWTDKKYSNCNWFIGKCDALIIFLL